MKKFGLNAFRKKGKQKAEANRNYMPANKTAKEITQRKFGLRGKSHLVGILAAGSLFVGSSLFTTGCDTYPAGSPEAYAQEAMFHRIGAIGMRSNAIHADSQREAEGYLIGAAAADILAQDSTLKAGFAAGRENAQYIGNSNVQAAGIIASGMQGGSQNIGIIGPGNPITSDVYSSDNFKLITYNYQHDFNGDGALDYPEDYVGIKNKFKKSEEIIICYLPDFIDNNYLGKMHYTEIDIFGPKGDKLWTLPINNDLRNARPGEIGVAGGTVGIPTPGSKDSDLMESLINNSLGGIGAYKVVLRQDGRYIKTHEFEITE